MQSLKNTSTRRKNSLLTILIKIMFSLIVIVGIVIILNKIDFPSPNKEIEKIISNEKLKIVK